MRALEEYWNLLRNKMFGVQVAKRKTYLFIPSNTLAGENPEFV